MSYKTLLWLFVALICGSIAAFVVKQLFYSSSPKAEPVQAEVLRSVLVAKVNLNAGTELSAQNVRFDRVPESQIPRDAIYSFHGISKRKVINDIAEGSILRNLYDLEFVQEEKLETSYNPPGFSVVPIEIESLIGTSDQRNIVDLISLDKVLFKDDCVDLHIISEKQNSNALDSLKNLNQNLVDRLLVENVIVVNVFSEKRFSKTGNQQERFSIVSVLLNDEQKKIVEEEANQGKLRIVKKQKNESTTNNGSSTLTHSNSLLSFDNPALENSVNDSQNQTTELSNINDFSNNNSFLSDEFIVSSKPLISDLDEANADKNKVSEALLTNSAEISFPTDLNQTTLNPSLNNISPQPLSSAPSNDLQNQQTISEQNNSRSEEINSSTAQEDNIRKYYQQFQSKNAGQSSNQQTTNFQASRPVFSQPNKLPNAIQESFSPTVDQNRPDLQNSSTPLDEKAEETKPIFRNRNSSLNQLTQLSE